jgi:hypothetical protein
MNGINTHRRLSTFAALGLLGGREKMGQTAFFRTRDRMESTTARLKKGCLSLFFRVSQLSSIHITPGPNESGRQLRG